MSIPFAIRAEVLEQNLRQTPGQSITIQCSAGNPAARELAGHLKAVFERSSWRVQGVDEIERATDDLGLTLAVGSLPASQEMSAAYLSFTAAGIEVAPRLDPKLRESEAVLFVRRN